MEAAQKAVDAAQTAHDEYLAMQPPYVPSVAELFVTAQAASDAATDAGDAATKAVKDAMDASAKLDTMSVNGDSMAATANAQAVLNAQAAAAQAVMDAQAALDDAMAAKVHADALADDDASKAGLVAALDAAIVVAEAQLKIATDASEGDELEAAVAAVTGDDEDEPMSPADLGRAVAMAIGEALGGETTDAALPTGLEMLLAPQRQRLMPMVSRVWSGWMITKERPGPRSSVQPMSLNADCRYSAPTIPMRWTLPRSPV